MRKKNNKSFQYIIITIIALLIKNVWILISASKIMVKAHQVHPRAWLIRRSDRCACYYIYLRFCKKPKETLIQMDRSRIYKEVGEEGRKIKKLAY